MLSVANTFRTIVRMVTRNQKPHTWTRYGDTDITGNVALAKSNYFRKLVAIEEINLSGYEFIVLQEDLTAISISTPKKGDVINHANFGILTLDYIDPIEDLGTVIAYRIRTV